MSVITNEIYKKTIPLFIIPQVAGQETKRKQVDFALEVHAGSTGRKELLLRLTDNNDPFFLHQLVLNEEDFSVLKNQQGILVDYSSFPPKLTELFELCLKESLSETPKFLLKFQESCLANGASTLSIVETTQFRHLVHLSLTLSLGNDCEVKKYLASVLSKLQVEKNAVESNLRSQVRDLESNLSECRRLLDDRNHELNVLKSDLDSRVSQMEAKFSQELAVIQEKHLKEKTSFQSEVEARRIERESFFQTSLGQYEDRIKVLESEQKELVDKKYKSESSIRDLKSKLQVLDEELNRTRAELNSLRSENASSLTNSHEKEKLINGLKTKVAVLEQDVKSKNHIIERSQEQVEMANQQRLKLDDNVELLKSKISEMEQNLKHATDDNNKANNIIRKLQEDLRISYGKLKLKNSVTVQQEKVISEKSSTLEKTVLHLKSVESDLKLRTEEVEKLGDELKSSNAKLEENQKLLDSNEKIIQYLNKQITDSQLTQRSNSNFGNSTNVTAKFRQGSTSGSVQNSARPDYNSFNNTSPMQNTASNISPHLNNNHWGPSANTYHPQNPNYANESSHMQENFAKTAHMSSTPFFHQSGDAAKLSPRERFPPVMESNPLDSLPSKYLKSSNMVNTKASHNLDDLPERLSSGRYSQARRPSTSNEKGYPLPSGYDSSSHQRHLMQTQQKIDNMSLASTANSTSSKAIVNSHKTPIMSAYFMPAHVAAANKNKSG
ncbi:spindle assembly abnormal protein 6 homolog [Symsagittifera roscoffensis]|uniref:spindle assembly abnormal protein 6 homolog n=1 Tax=Symsagittifera roscoffensis TaxID=84072 RepID=UPI00307C6341